MPRKEYKRGSDVVKGKILLVVGLAVGYVLGTRAGRERYEQLKAGAQRLWTNPAVQSQVYRAEQYVRERAPEVVEKVESVAKNVTQQLRSKRGSGSTPANGS